MQQAVSPTLAIRSTAQQGRSPMGYVTDGNVGRLGPETTLRAVYRVVELHIDGEPVTIVPNLDSRLTLRITGCSSGMTHLPLAAATARLGR